MVPLTQFVLMKTDPNEICPPGYTDCGNYCHKSYRPCTLRTEHNIRCCGGGIRPAYRCGLDGKYKIIPECEACKDAKP